VKVNQKAKRKLPLKQISLHLLYNDSDANSEPRQKDKNVTLLENYENNKIYVKLKLDKIKQIVNKRSTSKKKSSYNKNDTVYSCDNNNNNDNDNEDI